MVNSIQQIFQWLAPKPSTARAIQSVISNGLSYLDEPALRELCNQVEILEHDRRPGILIEAGCALGGSAIVMAIAKSKCRPFYIYDVFGMIPPPSDLDGQDVHERYQVIKSGKSQGIGGNRYYGYEENLYEQVISNFRSHGIPVGPNQIRLVKGLFQDTLHIKQPVALAHLDGDWYESVMTCLCRIEPRLVQGGVLVVDDYYAWSGCQKAVDDYFADKQSFYHFVRKSRLHIIRK